MILYNYYGYEKVLPSPKMEAALRFDYSFISFARPIPIG